MAKKIIRSKKAEAQVEAAAEATPAAPMPIVAEATAPVPAVDPATEARAKWLRRLKRWQAKADASGVDARALMSEVLAA